MWNKFVRSFATLLANEFSCIYGCGFSGTYEEVQNHQAIHGYGGK